MFPRHVLRKVARTSAVTLEHRIGRGGQGEVWRVRASRGPHAGRVYALKICQLRSRGQQQAFEHEAHVATTASAPGLLTAHGVFRGQGWGALLLPWVDGMNLAVLLRLWASSGRVLGPEAGAALLAGLHEALCAVHRLGPAGWVHGDVAPHNILIDRQGRMTVIDLGAAQPVGRVAPRIIGRAGHMAPEQARGEVLTPAVDAYAVGRVLQDVLRPAASGELAKAAAQLVQASPQARPSLATLASALDPDECERGRAVLSCAVRSCMGNAPASVEVAPQTEARSAARRARQRASWLANYRWLTTAAGFGVMVGAWLRLMAAT